MLGAIRYNLASLTRFNGRDARQTFWFYVLFLVIVQYAVGMALSMPMMGSIFTEAVNGAHEGLSQADMQSRMMAGMGGYLRVSMIGGFIVGVIGALLLLAAFVRRLHDSNRSGWLAGLAFALSIASKIMIFVKMDELVAATLDVSGGGIQAAMAAQSKMIGATLIGWTAMLIVVVFGVWPSGDGANRYGESPVRF